MRTRELGAVAKLSVYGLGLVAVFGAAAGVGWAAGPLDDEPESHENAAHGQDSSGHTEGRSSGQAVATVPGGLQISADGYTLVPQTTSLKPGQATTFKFTVKGPDGTPVTNLVPNHEKKLHLIVVRRDMAHYQHLHPAQDGNGVWSVRLKLPAPGSYRAFADFMPGTTKKALTLGMDLSAPGDYAPEPLPAAARSAKTDDAYSARIEGNVTQGKTSKLTLDVRKDGKQVADLQPYLGAYGHLVILREGDLAYLHVHPDGAPGDGRTTPGPRVTFFAEVPTTGRYRLFFDFKHRGKVRTAEFTASTDASPAKPEPSNENHGDDGHGH